MLAFYKKLFFILLIFAATHYSYASDSTAAHPNRENTILNTAVFHLKNHDDSIKRPFLFFSFNYGKNIPGLSYAANTFNLYDHLYAGFASAGYIYSASVEFRIPQSDWRLDFMANYFHNGFDASGFITENQMAVMVSSYQHDVFTLITGSEAIGSYSYDHSAFCLGISKTFNPNEIPLPLLFSVHFLIGGMAFTLPTINGTLTESGQDTISKKNVSSTFNYTVYSKTYTILTGDVGFKLGAKISPNLAAFAGIDFMLAQVDFDNSAQITDTNGNLVNSTHLYTSVTVFLSSLTFGIEFGF